MSTGLKRTVSYYQNLYQFPCKEDYRVNEKSSNIYGKGGVIFSWESK